jgi:1,4-alpha-glucan branching enzyme/maltooligosyltrehalose trehalohydrolase
VRQGRKKEFADAYAKFGDEVPDPLDESTFKSAVLDWSERDSGAGAARLALVKRLLKIRRDAIVPRLTGARFGDADVAEDGLLRAHWRIADGGTLKLIANISDKDVASKDAPGGTILWGDDWDGIIPPWAVSWRLEES